MNKKSLLQKYILSFVICKPEYDYFSCYMNFDTFGIVGCYKWQNVAFSAGFVTLLLVELVTRVKKGTIFIIMYQK